MGFVWTDEDGDDDDSQQQQQGQKPPELPPAARAHLRKVEKELKEAKDQLTALQGERRKASVADVLKAQGYDPAIAELIPSTVENSEEALTKWLGERSAIFAKLKTPDTDAPPADTGEVDPAIAAAFGAISNVESSAQMAGKEKDILAQLNSPTLTRAQLDAIVRAGGAKF